MKVVIPLLLLSFMLQVSCSNEGSIHKKHSAVIIDTAIDRHDSILQTGWYYILDSGHGFKKQVDRSKEIYFLDPHPIVTAMNFTTLSIHEWDQDDKHFASLTIHFDDEGTEAWSKATGSSIEKRLALVIDNMLIEVPMVMSQISSGISALNSRNYTKEEVEAFKIRLEEEKGK